MNRQLPTGVLRIRLPPAPFQLGLEHVFGIDWHSESSKAGVDFMTDEEIEKLFAILGQTVASVLADMRLEIFALCQMLAEQ